MRNIMIATTVIAMAGAGFAQSRVKEVIISEAATAAWTFEGSAKTKPVAAPAGVPGGQAIQVAIAQKGVNPWAVQARLPMKDGIAANDTVTFGFYARAAKPDPGQQTATLSVRLQRNATPYDAALEGMVTVEKDWRFVCLSGPAKIALAASELVASVQLAGDKRTVEFGAYMATKIPSQGPNIRSGLPCGQPVAG